MKKISILLGAFALALTSQAQVTGAMGPEQRMAPRPAAQNEINKSITARPAVAAERGGTLFFSEDFANGFDGNNAFGAWTFEDSGGNTIWMEANANSPAGEFSTSIAPLNSATSSNGWVIFDCDFYNTPISNGVEDVTGWLRTPELDCSALSSVIVEYSQYFRYCCFPASPLTLEVSTDGGNSWTVFPAHGSFTPSANTLSANPQVTTVDISCAATGEPSVYLRWGYNTAVEAGYSHYFWGIDDVSIYENEVVNDLEITQVTNGDVFNIWEYRITPLEQAVASADGGVLAGVIYRNNGNSDQTNTIITVDVLDESDNVLATVSTEPFTMESFVNTPECPSYLLDTLYISTNWQPTAVGNYFLRATVTSDAIDEVPATNERIKDIVFSTDEYGHDDETALDLEIGPRESEDSPGEWDPTGYGCFYTHPNSGSTAYGVVAVLGASTEATTAFQSIIYQGSPNDNQVAGSGEYVVTEEQLDDEFEYYPFEEAVDITIDEVYFAGLINNETSPTQLTIAAQSNSDTDNSTGVYELGGSGDYVWFSSQNWTPAVRLILADRGVGIDENESAVSNFSVYPNPAVNNTNVQFTLKSSEVVAYEVRDINGKLIEYKNLGRMAQGTSNINLNVSAYAAGNYQVSLVVAGAEFLTQKFTVVK